MTHASPKHVETDSNVIRLWAELEHRTKVTPAMLHSINKEGRLISVSDAWLAKLGYTREEVIGRSSSDFLTPESRAHAINEVLPAFFETGHIDDAEYQMVCKNGRIIDVLLSAVLDDSSPEIGGVSLAVVTDVTALKTVERQLAASETRYRGLVEDQSELISLASPEGVLRFVNHAYARHYGLQPDEMIGRSLFDFVPEDSHAAVAAHLRYVCSVDHSVEDENQVILPNGQTRWMAWRNRALTDADGHVVAIHSVARDIDDRVAAEQRLKESEARYRLLADHGSDMVFQLDRDLVRRYVSPACREILGYEPEELIGNKPMNLAHPDERPQIILAFQALLNGSVERRSVINRFRHRDGHWIWVEAQLKTLKDPKTGKPTGIIGTLRDVSARKAIEDELQDANRRLQALAEQDGLTGLANRRFFDNALLREAGRAAQDKTSLGLLMIDVDWFKAFNDCYGHPAGDECLKRIGATIQKIVSRPGDVAARYGGEEFAALLPDTDEPAAAAIAEQIRRAVLELAIEHRVSPNQVATISVGAASLTEGAITEPATLLHNADRALYRAKENGRNRVACSTPSGTTI
ncbi:sensor domain-containing diguanylate cyclase [Rhizobium rhizogenes]|uniref:sensor domain-containing diguanylate cyclase n=1 Tax=Rhizobium rhizogenes TaxID=359 RepID=UPI0004D991BD|nr:sensor domain-containing diguanylate cyclase [Rhizobium rhizogenes]KEA08376.1 diguanylate cyclase [Rhizobium rhizogenes]MQB31344.1 sensor domain-containing diguanylate cyclase [Rhizobium rhizogenes]NTF70835.1 PAS domain S-box protein [Rhizobium rhizogenes]NTI83489.1 PAS domain S-box protein [Rhizobium rhizogenes]NTJ25564.1 PAS domain S-box protein [Rhizobium rhizogenes]